MLPRALPAVALSLALCAQRALAFSDGDVIRVLASHIGPVNNRECSVLVLHCEHSVLWMPHCTGTLACAGGTSFTPPGPSSPPQFAASETYQYSVLPYCTPGDASSQSPDIAESLTGACAREQACGWARRGESPCWKAHSRPGARTFYAHAHLTHLHPTNRRRPQDSHRLRAQVQPAGGVQGAVHEDVLARGRCVVVRLSKRDTHIVRGQFGPPGTHTHRRSPQPRPHPRSRAPLPRRGGGLVRGAVCGRAAHVGVRG